MNGENDTCRICGKDIGYIMDGEYKVYSSEHLLDKTSVVRVIISNI